MNPAMKSVRILFTVAALSLVPSSAIAQADHGHEHSSEPEWAELFGDASLPTVWLSASQSSEHIAAALKAGQLEGVADWAETIHLAAHALMDQVEESDAAKKLRLNAVLGQAAEIADEVLDGAQHGEMDRTARAFKRLRSAVMLTKMRLPKTVTEGTADAPRFAQAGGHSHGDDEHGH